VSAPRHAWGVSGRRAIQEGIYVRCAGWITRTFRPLDNVIESLCEKGLDIYGTKKLELTEVKICAGISAGRLEVVDRRRILGEYFQQWSHSGVWHLHGQILTECMLEAAFRIWQRSSTKRKQWGFVFDRADNWSSTRLLAAWVSRSWELGLKERLRETRRMTPQWMPHGDQVDLWVLGNLLPCPVMSRMSHSHCHFFLGAGES